LGDEKEYLFLHAADVLRKDPVDYFIFGHRHLSFNRPLNGARVVNLGDWFTKNTYAVYDGENVKLITE
jgi:UDP-2,3-diacylglucosamine hydrolase